MIEPNLQLVQITGSLLNSVELHQCMTAMNLASGIYCNIMLVCSTGFVFFPVLGMGNRENIAMLLLLWEINIKMVISVYSIKDENLIQN